MIRHSFAALTLVATAIAVPAVQARQTPRPAVQALACEAVIDRTLAAFLGRADVQQVIIAAGPDSDVLNESDPHWRRPR